MHFFSLKSEWNEALAGVDCSNSPLICIKHFEDNSVFSNAGKFRLRPNSVPTIFGISLHSDKQQDEHGCLNVDEIQLLEMEIQTLNDEIINLKGTLAKSEENAQRKIDDLEKDMKSQAECIDKLKKLINMYESYFGKTPEFIENVEKSAEQKKKV